MRRTLAIVLIALSALIGLPGTSHAKGDTEALVVVTNLRSGHVVTLVHNSPDYMDLERVLAADPLVRLGPPPRGQRGDDFYQLAWLSRMSELWRKDTLFINRGGTAHVATTIANLTVPMVDMEDPAPRETTGGELAGVLDKLFAGTAATTPVVLPVVEQKSAAPAVTKTSSRFSLAGWGWAVPGVLGGLLVGLVAPRLSLVVLRERSRRPSAAGA